MLVGQEHGMVLFIYNRHNRPDQLGSILEGPLGNGKFS